MHKAKKAKEKKKPQKGDTSGDRNNTPRFHDPMIEDPSNLTIKSLTDIKKPAYATCLTMLREMRQSF